MSLEDLVHILNSNHFYPAAIVEKGKITSLEIYCPAIQSISRLEKVKEVCGDEWIIDFVSKDEVIVIQKK